jgi:hypothetical protein
MSEESRGPEPERFKRRWDGTREDRALHFHMDVGEHLWEALEQIAGLDPSAAAVISRIAMDRVWEEREAYINREEIIDAREALVADGLIKDSGMRRNGQIVWVMTDKGRAATPEMIEGLPPEPSL